MGGLPLPTSKNRQKIFAHRKRIEREVARRFHSSRGRGSSPLPTTSGETITFPELANAPDLPEQIQVQVGRRAEGVVTISYTHNNINYYGVLLAENTVNGAPGICRDEMLRLRNNLDTLLDASVSDQWTSTVGERFMTNGFPLRERSFARKDGRMLCSGCLKPITENEPILRRHFIDANQRKILGNPRESLRLIAKMPDTVSQPSVHRTPTLTSSSVQLESSSVIGCKLICKTESERRNRRKPAHPKFIRDGLSSTLTQTERNTKEDDGDQGSTKSSIEPLQSKALQLEKSKIKDLSKVDPVPMKNADHNDGERALAYTIRKSDSNDLHITLVRKPKEVSEPRLPTVTHVPMGQGGQTITIYAQNVAITPAGVSVQPNTSFTVQQGVASDRNSPSDDEVQGSSESLSCFDRPPFSRSQSALPIAAVSSKQVESRQSSCPPSTVEVNLDPVIDIEPLGPDEPKQMNDIVHSQSPRHLRIPVVKSGPPKHAVDASHRPKPLNAADVQIRHDRNVSQNDAQVPLLPVRTMRLSEAACPPMAGTSEMHLPNSSYCDDYQTSPGVEDRIYFSGGIRMKFEVQSRSGSTDDDIATTHRLDNTSTVFRSDRYSRSRKKCHIGSTTDTDHFERSNSSHTPPFSSNSSKFVENDIVWAKLGSHPFWPGKVYEPSGCDQAAKSTIGIVWFGHGTYSPHVNLDKVERFIENYEKRFNPKRAEIKYQRGVVEAIIKSLPKRGYFEKNLPVTMYRLLQDENVDLSGVSVINKRKKRQSSYHLSIRRKKSPKKLTPFCDVAVVRSAEVNDIDSHSILSGGRLDDQKLDQCNFSLTKVKDEEVSTDDEVGRLIIDEEQIDEDHVL
ncbi:hypothetical protein AB6A40_002318 [Gnathostoma spinigerum]|uniref:PWWP domain-containing protein n=1 Tax=Gnathostoma spinigerum TaxID=75299 RepID=A0ABD6EBU0_9BILA